MSKSEICLTNPFKSTFFEWIFFRNCLPIIGDKEIDNQQQRDWKSIVDVFTSFKWYYQKDFITVVYMKSVWSHRNCELYQWWHEKWTL